MSAHSKLLSIQLAKELKEAMDKRGFHKSYASKFLDSCDETLDEILSGECDVCDHPVAREFIDLLNKKEGVE